MLLDKKLAASEVEKNHQDVLVKKFMEQFKNLPAVVANKSVTNKAYAQLAENPEQKTIYADDALLEKYRKNPHKKTLALSPYEMNYDDPNDALSGAANGYKVLFEVFRQKIYAERPFSAMFFTMAALLGGLPAIVPGLAERIPSLLQTLYRLLHYSNSRSTDWSYGRIYGRFFNSAH